MGLMSRTKGRRGESELAGLLADLTGWTVRRRVRQHDGDSDIDGLPGWSVEVKRHASGRRADIRTWWEQAEAQAKSAGLLPVLFFRLNRDDWRAVWPVGTLVEADPWTGYEWTIEGSLNAWATIAREIDAAIGPQINLDRLYGAAPSEPRPPVN